MEMKVLPVTLTGRFVRLEPLALSHVADMFLAAQDEDIWRYMLYGTIRTQADMRAWVEDLLGRQKAGTDLPFAVVHLASGHIAGATRYLDIRPAHRSLEIGGTWYGTEYQRTAVNTECKYLLLRHAFEALKCIRVQLKADARNERSLRAMERIGAIREGVFRNHMVLPDGTVRDSVFYSIIAAEWPQVKAGLETKLAR